MDLKKDSINCLKCHHRHPQNGNCTAVGGFCTSVPAAYCPLITELFARAEAAEQKAENAEIKLAAYEQTGLEPEAVLSATDMAKVACALHELNKYKKMLGTDYDLDRLREIVQADRDGRCVVLPVPLHSVLLDMSDISRPDLLKDFRISATWTHKGIVFHCPWNIFNQNIEKGHIRLMSESATAVLEGEAWR